MKYERDDCEFDHGGTLREWASACFMPTPHAGEGARAQFPRGRAGTHSLVSFHFAAQPHYLSRLEMKARQVENSKERNVVEASLPPRYISHKEMSTEVVKIDVLTGVSLAPVSHVSPHSR